MSDGEGVDAWKPRAWADCEITVKGDGSGRYSKPKEDKTGPLRQFLVFNQAYFQVVRDHLSGRNMTGGPCHLCDVTEILTVYLARLKEPPTKATNGKASDVLLDHVTKLVKIAAQTGRATPDKKLVNEFWLRGDADSLLSRRSQFSMRELAWAYRFTWGHGGPAAQEKLRRRSKSFEAIARILDAPAEEQESLLDAAEVMLA